jgi:hypothetical protein
MPCQPDYWVAVPRGLHPLRPNSTYMAHGGHMVGLTWSRTPATRRVHGSSSVSAEAAAPPQQPPLHRSGRAAVVRWRHARGVGARSLCSIPAAMMPHGVRTVSAAK